MTTDTTAADTTRKPKKKWKDAYIARVTISIPLDSANLAASLKAAEEAVGKIKDGLPAGAIIETTSSMGKIPEAA